MSTQFGNSVNQKITLSRKESSKYTNTLVCINKVWTAKPEIPMGQPKLMNKGGFAMWFDATFVVTFGNISNAGTSKIKAIKDGKQVEFAKRTNIQIDKNHINGVQSRGKIIMTPHGFINDTEKELKSYKDAHAKEWMKILGSLDFDVFEEEEGLVQSIETIYELSENEEFYKLVISIHGLAIEDTLIIHTKFIFKVDTNKRNLIDNSLIYLYDINCNYHKLDFRNIVDMKNKIEDIMESNDFGEDIQILSDFIEAPAMFLNYYMRRAKITEYSIFDVKYEPKFKTTPCDKTTFDFEVDVNNNYKFDVSIYKIDRKSDDEENDTYRYQFKFMDDIETIEIDTLRNIHFTIGSNIARILDKKLK
jgi:hypothetical protein